jgi:hypothetical protein
MNADYLMLFLASLAFTAVLIVFPEPTDESEFIFEETATLVIFFLVNELLQLILTVPNILSGIIGMHHRIQIGGCPFVSLAPNIPGDSLFLGPLSC